jgi:lipopolysaccharide/colanic/teichoic acid biosynthesis glycosyltransferase
VVGFVDDFLPAGTPVLDGIGVLGSPERLDDLASRLGVKQVIVVPNAVAWETFQELMYRSIQSNGFEILLSPGFYEVQTTSVQVTQRGAVPLLRVEQARIVGLDWLLKTILDRVLSLVMLVLTAPAMLAIVAGVRMGGHGPVLYRQSCLGLQGQPFSTLRFRTDLVGLACRQDGSRLDRGSVESLRFGSRVGRLLFCTGLDKLPQLVDVARGQLSLVGPRPIDPRLEGRYRPWLPNLLTVKPGWTGPWAVSGAASREEELLLDLYYVRNWTIWLDLQILFQTIKLVLFGHSRLVGGGDQ